MNVNLPITRSRRERMWLALIGAILMGMLQMCPAQEQLPRLLDKFSYSHWGRDDGMMESTVVTIKQSPDGFIWCLTPNHLLFFDGVRFEDRDHLDSGSAQAPYPILYRGLAVDNHGMPWVYGQRGAMQRKAGDWQRPYPILAYHEMLDMLTDSSNQFWAATPDGLWQIDDNQGGPPMRIILPSQLNRLTAVVADSDGNLRIGSESGLFYFKTNTFTQISVDGIGNLSGISCLQMGRSNDWWICCQEGLLHQRGEKWDQVALPFPAREAGVLLEDHAGGVWVGTKQGLYRYYSGTWSVLNAASVANPMGVLSLMEDHQNRLWVGTSDGLLCLRSKLVSVLFSNPKRGLQAITSLALNHGTNVWVGSLNDGLLRIVEGELKSSNQFNLPLGVIVSSLCPDNVDGLWVGTLGDHLFHLGTDGVKKFTAIKNFSGSAREITAILETDTNQVWVGTWQGLFQMTNEVITGATAARMDPVLLRNSGSHSFSPVAGRVSALASDKDGGVWIGYDGLWILRKDQNPEKGVYGYGWGLPGPNVRTFFRDSEGRLWAGTSQGLGLLTSDEWQKVLGQNKLFELDPAQRTRDRARWESTLGKTPLWERMTEIHGLADADIRQITEDKYGRIWLGTRKGIQVFDRKSLVAVMDGRQPFAEGRFVGLEEGMVSEECTLNASPGVVRDATGRLYFATTDGLVVADPAQFNPATNLPPVYIQVVKAHDMVIYERSGNTPISPMPFKLAAVTDQEFTLPAGQRDVAFDLATPIYDAPNRVRFRWRLDGVDRDWSAPSAARKAEYPRLAPGDYTFRAMVGRQGSWREIAYGKSKNVGVILYVSHLAAERQLDEILPLYEKWGVSGVKFGFVNVGSQNWTVWLHNAVRQAFAHHLMVDIHDEFRETGEQRTYPNLVTCEGIHGNESFPTPVHNATLPFTRLLTGPADYTFCWNDNRLKVTKAHQLAISTIFFSPWQFLYWYDRPAGVPEEPALNYWDHLPTTWDETRVLQGDIGHRAVVARRKGQEWFLGAIAPVDGRFNIPLGFLETGKKFTAQIYADKPGAPEMQITERIVDNEAVLSADIPANGGLAVHLIPLAQ